MRKIWQHKNDRPVCHFNKDLSDQKLVLESEKYFLLSKKVKRTPILCQLSLCLIIQIFLVDRSFSDQSDVSAYPNQSKRAFDFLFGCRFGKLIIFLSSGLLER